VLGGIRRYRNAAHGGLAGSVRRSGGARARRRRDAIGDQTRPRLAEQTLPCLRPEECWSSHSSAHCYGPRESAQTNSTESSLGEDGTIRTTFSAPRTHAALLPSPRVQSPGILPAVSGELDNKTIEEVTKAVANGKLADAAATITGACVSLVAASAGLGPIAPVVTGTLTKELTQRFLNRLQSDPNTTRMLAAERTHDDRASFINGIARTLAKELHATADSQTSSVEALNTNLDDWLTQLFKCLDAKFQHLESMLAAVQTPSAAGNGGTRGRVPRELPDSTTLHGRDQDFEQLASTTKHILICGMPGVGKTAFALGLASKLKTDYPDGQIWASLLGSRHERQTADEIRSYILRAIHPDLDPQERDFTGIYQTILADRRVLIVLDDVSDREQLQSLVPPAGCRVIATSRQRLCDDRFFTHGLECLSSNSAQEFLVQRVPRCSNEHAREIAELCANLPLSLSLVSAGLGEHVDLPIEYCIQKLKDPATRLDAISEIGCDGREVLESFQFSYELLDENLRRVWVALSVFPADFSRDAAFAVVTDPATPDVLSQLVRRGLIEYNFGRYHLHDLLRLYAARHLNPTDRTSLEKTFARHYSDLLARVGHQYDGPVQQVVDARRAFREEQANFEEAYEWSRRRLGADDEATQIGSDLFGGSSALDRELPIEKRRQWYEYRLAAARQLGAGVNELAALIGLAVIYEHSQDFERAVRANEQVCELAAERGDPFAVASALGNIGLIKNIDPRNRCNTRERMTAIEYLERSLRLCEQRTTDRTFESGWAYLWCHNHGNLGDAHLGLHNIAEAKAHYEMNVALAERFRNAQSLGWAHIGLAHVAALEGNARDTQGHLKKAEDLAESTGDKRLELRISLFRADPHVDWLLNSEWVRIGP